MNDAERMVISAYCDSEVESPWKERVAQRIAEDAEWAAEEARHRKIKALLETDPEPRGLPSADAVLARARARMGQSPSKTKFPLVWISTAAAALLLVAAGAGYWAGVAAAGGSAVPIAELQVDVPHSLGLKLSGEGQLLMASTLEGSSR